MINSLLKKSILINEPNLTGITNVIQDCDVNDVLVMHCKSENQLNDLIETHLPDDFQGLLICPFSPRKKINYLVKNIDDLKTVEEGLINHFYPIPNNILPKIIGVTGTNGKTSVCWLLAEVCRLNNKSSLYAGTPGVYLNGTKMENTVLTTTPSYMSLRKLVFQYGSSIDLICIEVSSHALVQKRLGKLKLEAGGWTNFTQDHLDYHGSMEEYFEAKRKIFDLVIGKKIYIPKGDENLRKKLKDTSAVIAKTIEEYKNLLVSEVFKKGFPKFNLELALSLYEEVFGDFENKDLKGLTLPPGRFQIVLKNDKVFIVDYAHTPDALGSVLEQVKFTYPRKKILTVFGCGGNRDKSKRPLMREAASRLSDLVIITSDNPRFEDPNEIIEDIMVGSLSGETLVEVDREKAIRLSNTLTDSNWVILVAGKGHEAYQEIMGVRHDFDDVKKIKGLT